MHRTTLRFLVTALVVALSAGCVRTIHRNGPNGAGGATDLPPPANQLESIRRSGTLRVGMATSLPWAMHSRSGDLIGFEVDVARQLAADLGVALAIVPASRPHILDDLLESRFDLIVSRLPIDPATSLLVNFSDPYNENDFTLVAHRQRAAGLRGREAFDRANVRLGVRRGTVGAEIAASAFPRADVQDFDDEDALYEALLHGALHGVVLGSPAPEFLVRQHPRELVLPLDKPLSRRSEAFGIRKGEPDFVTYLNAWIRHYEETGWLAERRRYWFGSFAWADEL